ncbi:SpaA isopeptide-forming pilin-related protein [Enterococcus hulanensis]|uniref:SpaA isopeptide-forming pilin-related protein n=1 Tax=Enterococcus hulanensis TaxID=2559929 RepID=UPI00148518AE|nr:SpaA isopeptide-forming pilin-related protein [Enterococcus hulanensis]
MQKKRLKKPVVIFLPIILLIGAIIIYQMAPIGKILNASNQTSLFKVAVDGENITDTAFVTEKEKVEVQLTAKEAGIYKLPYDEENYRLEYVNKEAPLPYYETNNMGFDMENNQIIFHEVTSDDEHLTTELTETESSEVVEEETSGSEIQTPNIESLPEFVVVKISDEKETSKGYFYLKLDEGDSVLFNVQWTSTKEQTLVVTDTTDKEKEQTLLTFGKIEEAVKEETSKTNTTESKKEVKKEDKKDADSKKAKGMEVSIAPLELKGGADVVRLKDPKLTIQTGATNFDPDDEPGHDSSPSNDIVRTWDTVTYTYSFSVESTNSLKTYKDVKYRVDAEFKDSRKKTDGQLRDYAYFPQGTRTGNNLAETRDATFTTSGVISGSTGLGEGAVNLHVLGATHGYELAPTITITILEVTDAETGEQITINASSENMVQKSVKVSAKPNIKATIGSGDSVVNLMSSLSPTSGLNSFAQGMGMELAVVPLTDDGISRTGSLYEMLYGATFPKGEVKVSVRTNAYSVLDSNGYRHEIIYGSDQDAPQVISEGFLDVNNRTSSTLNKTPEFEHLNMAELDMGNSGWNIAFSKIVTDGEQAVFDTNIAKVANTSTKNTLNYSFTNSAAVYKPIVNNVVASTNDNIGKLKYASVFTLMNIPYDYILDKNASLYTQFETTNISYENQDYSNDSVYTNSSPHVLGGKVMCYTPTIDSAGKYIGSGIAQQWAPSGDGGVYKGQKIYAYPIYNVDSLQGTGIDAITAWNAEVYQYDNSRNLYFPYPETIQKYFYGVLKDKSKIPSLDAKYSIKNNEYDWYSTYEEAKEKGTVSAIKSIFKKNNPDKRLETRTRIPLIVIGDKYNDFQSVKGDGNFLISSINGIDDAGEVKHTFPTTGSIFQPSVLDETEISGIKKQIPGRTYGETLMVVPFIARLTKQAVRTSYSSSEVIQWKLTPDIQAADDDDVTFTIKDTLPKELTYISGSTKYGTKEIEPVEKKESDGSTTLTWTIRYHKDESPIQTLVFDTMINGKNIKYDATNTAKVTNHAVISAENKDGLKDESIEELREAKANTIITKVSITTIEKSTSNSKIEVGTNNPVLTDGERDTTIHYSLYNKNESKTSLNEIKILDVFPNVKDGRGTTFNGTFDLLSVKVTSINKPKIYYSIQPIENHVDPNDVDISSGWSVYNGGRITDVKAIYLKYDQLDVGEENTIDISLVAKNQKAKDIMVNSAKLDNSNINPVQSVFVKSAVIARSIKGVAWYDDNLDGKKNPTETMVPNIPVKLYRTSHENGTYKNELVKANLTGLKFIDDSGNSSIKTSSTGDYEFNHLPEGDYVVYFEIGDDVVAKKYKVTKKDSAPSSQTVDTSKADLTTYKTDSYETPTLTGGNFPDSEWKVQNINIGLVRPSTIRLFKYATGTAIDANGDGKLSDAEKATGTPLKDAEFDIYKGDLEEKLGSAKTDDTGHLEFTPLFEGDYTLVETKAPEGYELIKSPIKVTITEGNQTIQVYQEDDKKTDLPFTGGTGPMLLLLIIVSGMGILGLGGLYWYYRQPSRKGEG